MTEQKKLYLYLRAGERYICTWHGDLEDLRKAMPEFMFCPQPDKGLSGIDVYVYRRR